MKEFKLSLTTLVVLVISTLFSLASCEKGDDFTQRNMLQVHATDGNTDINLSNCQYNLDNLPLEDLSDLSRDHAEEVMELGSPWTANENVDVITLDRDVLDLHKKVPRPALDDSLSEFE